jgi:hypothetical protein
MLRMYSLIWIHSLYGLLPYFVFITHYYILGTNWSLSSGFPLPKQMLLHNIHSQHRLHSQDGESSHPQNIAVSSILIYMMQKSIKSLNSDIIHHPCIFKDGCHLGCHHILKNLKVLTAALPWHCANRYFPVLWRIISSPWRITTWGKNCALYTYDWQGGRWWPKVVVNQ